MDDGEILKLSALLKSEMDRIKITSGPPLRMFDYVMCDGMRAVDHFGRLAVEICHGWNTSRHDAPSVLRALASFTDAASPSFGDVYNEMIRLRKDRSQDYKHQRER